MIDTPRHDLDEVIDRVAAKLVAVTDDERLMQQVMLRLPERTASPWLAAMPVQLAAAAALLLVAFLYARPARVSEPPQLPQIAIVAPAVSPAASVTPGPAPPRTQGRRDPALRIQLVSLERADHERSLAPVAPLPALELTSIRPAALEPDAAAELAPLVLTDLPLAGDFISPREP